MTAGDGRRQMWVEWISVKDGMPPCASTVLAYVPKTGRRLRAFYLASGCIYIDPYDHPRPGWYEDTEYSEKTLIGNEVTHWMELPRGPE